MSVPRSSVLCLLVLAAACKPAEATTSAAATAGPPVPAAAVAAGVPAPLGGLWRQASVTCADGRVPDEKVDELAFGSETDPDFYSVTYAPFETYKDYWGKARFDLGRGEFAFTVDHGNFVPPGLDLEGRVKLEGNSLTLSEAWLGDRAPGAAASPGCTYVFSRFMGGD